MEHCPRTMTCSRQNANILRKSCPGIDHATLNSPFIAEVHGTNILNQLTATPCQLMIRGSLVGDSHILGESRGCRNDINPGNKCDCPHPHGTRKIRQPQKLGGTFWLTLSCGIVRDVWVCDPLLSLWLLATRY